MALCSCCGLRRATQWYGRLLLALPLRARKGSQPRKRPFHGVKSFVPDVGDADDVGRGFGPRRIDCVRWGARGIEDRVRHAKKA